MLRILNSQLKSRLVEDWRQAYRWFSVQLHAFALLYLSLYTVMPVFDPHVAALLPSPMQAPVITTYAVLGILARLIAQRPAPPPCGGGWWFRRQPPSA